MALVCTGVYTIALVCVSFCLPRPSGPFEMRAIHVTHKKLGLVDWLCIVVPILLVCVCVGVFCVADGVLEQAEIWVQSGQPN